MLKSFILLMCFILSGSLKAGELKGVTMPDSIEVSGEKLQLNGMGIRVKNKFGLDFNVYIGGLYTKKQMRTAEEIIADKNRKRIIMHFIMAIAVDKKKIVNAWKKVFAKTCEHDCKNMKPHYKAFYKLMDDMKKGQKFTLDLTQEAVTVTGTGRYKKSGSIQSPAFSKNLLLAFISLKLKPNKLNTGLVLGKPRVK